MATAQRALNDVKGFGHVPSNVTIENVHLLKSSLEDLVHRKVMGTHKINEVLQYIRHGPKAFVQQNINPEKELTLDTIDKLVENL
jgi:hypothetical protein